MFNSHLIVCGGKITQSDRMSYKKADCSNHTLMVRLLWPKKLQAEIRRKVN